MTVRLRWDEVPDDAERPKKGQACDNIHNSYPFFSVASAERKFPGYGVVHASIEEDYGETNEGFIACDTPVWNACVYLDWASEGAWRRAESNLQNYEGETIYDFYSLADAKRYCNEMVDWIINRRCRDEEP